MKILVHGINYYPELTGIGKYTAEMCEWLAGKGHEVHVITAMPYYPEWRVHKAYRGKLWHKEIINGVMVYRTPLYVPSKITGKTRIIHEFSFAFFSLPFWGTLFFKKYDVILSICPPFHLGFIALCFGFLRRLPIVYHIQDLQVDAARRLHLIRNDTVLNILEKSEAFIFRHATKVSSISKGMKRNILEKGISEKKYIDLPNWVDTDFIRPLAKSQSLREELGFKAEDKIVLYSGNMGGKQGLEMILDVADKLKGKEGLYFIMVGEGTSKKFLMEEAEKRQINNVKFFPLQPYEKFAAMLAVADIHLVLQKRAAEDLVLPSKLMTILSAGGVSIVTAAPNTSLFDLVQDYSIGILIPPEEENALAAAIVAAFENDLTEIGKNARNYAVNKLSIHQILTSFEKDLLKLIDVKNG